LKCNLTPAVLFTAFVLTGSFQDNLVKQQEMMAVVASAGTQKHADRLL